MIEGGIDLGATLDALARAAVAAAGAGADGVSPSDMMDGRTAHLRAALDDDGHGRVPIMSYSTKFASQFYGPFRAAADSAPQFGNRRHYQIDVRSRRDAIGSSVRCANEGADLLMVKPALTSLDLIAPIAEATGLPVGAYQVSGEYASLVALAERGFADFDAALAETLHVLRRAGAAYRDHLRRAARASPRPGMSDSGPVRTRPRNRAGRRAQPGPRVSRRRRHAGFLCLRTRRAADRRHPAATTSTSA